MIILHPPCDYIALCGNRWYGQGTPGNCLRLQSIDWTIALWELAKKYSNKCALENPLSVIWKFIGKPQYIQPWQFGHGETKKTGILTYNLPDLIPTNIVEGRVPRVHRMPPGKDRKRDRSESYKGILAAMADQWGPFL
jgi:hypothetical protein